MWKYWVNFYYSYITTATGWTFRTSLAAGKCIYSHPIYCYAMSLQIVKQGGLFYWLTAMEYYNHFMDSFCFLHFYQLQLEIYQEWLVGFSCNLSLIMLLENFPSKTLCSELYFLSTEWMDHNLLNVPAAASLLAVSSWTMFLSTTQSIPVDSNCQS